MSEAASVAVVIAIFDPASQFVDNVRVVLAQTPNVIVIDDGSAAPDTPRLLSDVERMGVTVLRSLENLGIAHALNRGVRAACESMHAKYILTLDQDTVLAPDYVARVLETFRRAPSSSTTIGIVACESVGTKARPVLRVGAAGRVPFDPFQSGMVIRASLFEQLGYFREDLFIDGVDVEFYLRAMNAGHQVLVAPGATMIHELGSVRTVRFLGYQRAVSYRQPYRRYYIVRNRLALLWEMKLRQPRWSMLVIVNELLGSAKGFVVGPFRRKQMMASVAGVRDFLTGRSGRIPDELLRRVTPQASSVVSAHRRGSPETTE